MNPGGPDKGSDNPASAIPEKQLLELIATVLSHYICETNPYILFNGLLEALLEITSSEYGFIGEVFHDDGNHPYIKCYATTNIAWDSDTRKLYEENRQKGMLFSKLDSLYGSVLKTGQLVISNAPASDPRSGGLPRGHPPLNTFMGLPFYAGGKLLGMVGIANRKNGYDREIADALHPFLVACGNLIQAYRNNRKRQHAEQELDEYRRRMPAEARDIFLGQGYRLSRSPTSLSHDDIPVLLSRKELLLLEILALNLNRPVAGSDIETHVWPDTIVGVSSLRSLMRRLRPKLPGLEITTLSGVGYLLTGPEQTVTEISQINHT
jgi:DNA-binding winged helix-turn-helix (wHTH) protein